MKQRWFEQNDWNKEIELLFFEKLSNSKRENASQYIRIQAIKFLSMNNEQLNKVSFRLIQLLFESYPERHMDIMFCHEALAEHYYLKEEYDMSFTHYEIIRNYNKLSPNAQYCTITSELGMLKCLIRINYPSKTQCVKELIKEILPYVNNKFPFLDRIRKDFIATCTQLNKELRDIEVENIISSIN